MANIGKLSGVSNNFMEDEIHGVVIKLFLQSIPL